MRRAFGNAGLLFAAVLWAGVAAGGISRANETGTDVSSGNAPPELLTFEISEVEAGVYTLSGTVNDDYPEGCYIQFGGALDGYYAAVFADGTFGTTAEVGYYERGSVSAQAVDDVDQGSNILWDAIL